MQPEEFRLIKEFVLESYGLVLEEGKTRYLAVKLLPRLEELRLDSFSDYYGYLKFAPRRDRERQLFISLITNNETYFFREEAQLRVLSEKILPKLKEEKLARGERGIHILSAGCSSGEEVYTLAMLLIESGHLGRDWDFRITGVDVDTRVLERARAGAYSQNSFRGTAPQYLQSYFTARGDQMVIRELPRRPARFLEGNLLELADVVPERDVDIIFCRNVLIYFSDDTSKRVVDNFGAALSPGGFLFLGHSESLSRISADYQPLRFPGAIVYQRRNH